MIFVVLPSSVTKVRIVKFFLQLIMGIHVFACAWHWVACPFNECPEGHHWVEHQGRYPYGGRWLMLTTNLIEVGF